MNVYENYSILEVKRIIKRIIEIKNEYIILINKQNPERKELLISAINDHIIDKIGELYTSNLSYFQFIKLYEDQVKDLCRRL